MSKKFSRQEHLKYSKLGKGRKKLQKWRKPKGRDSKMRLKRKSYSKTVSIGYKSPKKSSGKINGMKPVFVYNIKGLSKLNKNSVAIIARVGARKKLDIIKHANEKKIKVLNLMETSE